MIFAACILLLFILQLYIGTLHGIYSLLLYVASVGSG